MKICPLTPEGFAGKNIKKIEMDYVILAVAITALIILISRAMEKSKTKSRLDELRMIWGSPKPKSEEVYFVGIKRYANIPAKDFHRLTDQTLDDIDFDKLFKFIDRTTSKVGQQYLYKKLWMILAVVGTTRAIRCFNLTR
ncbi:MAG TPA: hypothetical protein VIU12_30160 [Chryseolinea sp.]